MLISGPRYNGHPGPSACSFLLQTLSMRWLTAIYVYLLMTTLIHLHESTGALVTRISVVDFFALFFPYAAIIHFVDPFDEKRRLRPMIPPRPW
jgi:hypothetical protein